MHQYVVNNQRKEYQKQGAVSISTSANETHNRQYHHPHGEDARPIDRIGPFTLSEGSANVTGASEYYRGFGDGLESKQGMHTP